MANQVNEERKEYFKQYYLENKQKIRKNTNSYYWKNRQKILADLKAKRNSSVLQPINN